MVVDIHTYPNSKEKHEIVMKLTISVKNDPSLVEVLTAVYVKLVEMNCFRRKEHHG